MNSYKCPICGQVIEPFKLAENSVFTPYYCFDCDIDFREEELDVNRILSSKEKELAVIIKRGSFELKQAKFIDIILNNKKGEK